MQILDYLIGWVKTCTLSGMDYQIMVYNFKITTSISYFPIKKDLKHVKQF